MHIDLIVAGYPRASAKSVNHLNQTVLSLSSTFSSIHIHVFLFLDSLNEEQASYWNGINWPNLTLNVLRQDDLCSNHRFRDVKNLLVSSYDPYDNNHKSTINYLKYLFCLDSVHSYFHKYLSRDSLGILLRPDTISNLPCDSLSRFSSIIYSSKSPTIITPSHSTSSFINDRLFIGTINSLIFLTQRFVYYPSHLLSGFVPHSEYLTYRMLKSNGVTIILILPSMSSVFDLTILLSLEI